MRILLSMMALVALVFGFEPQVRAEQSVVVKAAGAEPVKATPAIWKVEKGEQTGWLFGTMHLLPSIDWKTPTVAQALDEAKIFVFEIEIDKIDPATAQQLIAKFGFLTDGRNLPDILGAERWAAVSEFAAGLGIPAASLGPMKPWLASLTLSQLYLVKQGFEPTQGVEAVLLQELRAKGARTESLETAEQQFSFFDNLSEEIQIALLETSLEDLKNNPDRAQDMLNRWATGDTEALAALLNESLADYPEAYDALLVARNRAWIPQLAELMANGDPVFAAVGAGHLVGPDSVVDLLKAEGYTVTRLK